jgi:hypothetical protein
MSAPFFAVVTGKRHDEVAQKVGQRMDAIGKQAS